MSALHVLSSMATRALLAELLEAEDGARLEAVGGVPAAARVRGGEAPDVVVLSEGVMRALAEEGHVRADSLRPLARSGIAVAVREGEPAPGLADAHALRSAMLAAGRVGYSTGPSGEHLLRLVEEWGLGAALEGRLVQAPPGVPVGRLLAEGAVDLAVQQRSELLGLPGVTVAGMLPAEAQRETVFAAGVARDTAEGRALVARLAAPGDGAARRRHGMEPA